MCAIAGIVAYREQAPPIDSSELVGIRDAMANRGPDGEGLWVAGDCRTGLAHRRLAIIDPSETGAQPMASADRGVHVTFNGEIYNYQALRKGLIAKGYRFRSTSDTEVLLNLYLDRGIAMVHDLRGMFAFALWDERDKVLFLARDPFGIKPLYYAEDGATFRFASQVKALVSQGTVGTQPEAAGHVGFFVLGSVPEPFTMYRSVRALPAGSTLKLARGAAPVISPFFDLTREAVEAARSPARLDPAGRDELLRAALAESVRHHMVADVPVGIYLSAGIDSSTIASLACRGEFGKLRSVTLGFPEFLGTADDEIPGAEEAARRLGMAHEAYRVTAQDFELELDRLLAAMDQPSIDGVNTYFVSKAAAAAGMKVALSGVGGDELFGGYPSFAQVPRLAGVLGFSRHLPWLGPLCRRLSAPLVRHFASPKIAGLVEYGGTYPGAYLLRRALYMPWEVDGFLDPDMFRDGWAELDLLRRLGDCVAGVDNPRQRVAVLEMSWYLRNQLLRDSDWAGMAHSVEIRTPLVDATLFRTLIPLLASAHPPTKTDVARVAGAALVEAASAREKTGFTTPVSRWIAGSGLAAGSRPSLRDWSRIVHRPYKRMRVLVLLSDAFAGHGGIALYNRDFLASLCSMETVAEVVAFPRLLAGDPGPIPSKLVYRAEAANSKLRFVREVTRSLLLDSRYDLVVCCHLNLLALSIAAKLRVRAPMMALIFGIDAWQPSSRARKALLRFVDRFVSISEVTRTRFQSWSGVGGQKVSVLPNALHRRRYAPGPKNPALQRRYGLEGKVVLVTLGRQDASERYKGCDEVLDAIAAMLGDIPNLAYLIVGGGSDEERLRRKAASMGLASQVRFAGVVAEAEKADHFRLADAYVMPSRGEGFGFVFLEAMACGIPVVASSLDGGREAVMGGRLGTVVDPTDPMDVIRGIREALGRQKGTVPQELEHFSFENFELRTHRIVRSMANGI
ncbi:MAG: asparagine synthase (glutamine-hydrolyzing) [Usitatibacter sp.]